ncbi:putative receptor-type tyrosine-protein phosphatase kappa [Apostichopus japonicus]|uniref:Putative receptor-type tyrosine-protein phosphatase kappa n=1 Tax=Stichopus japonicus TaxID=307972 RepID=A0A2G8LD47_STIJA|nr:putative receptor-type tyrosine-protein phosphatase kappa [Apostichopus japonicus]
MFTYDHSRVVLEKLMEEPDSDYYNASYILDQRGETSLIASQAPNKASLNDFWRLIWQEKVSTIDRCTQYWPNQEGGSKSFGHIVVSWATTVHFADFDVKELHVVNTSVTIKWRAWNEQTDVGDPPVVGYVVYYRKNVTESWSNVTIIESSQLLQYTQKNLEEDTIYAFSVSAVREGDMGEGRMGPPVTVKTLCGVQSTPTAVMATVTDLNQLNVTWQAYTSQDSYHRISLNVAEWRIPPRSVSWYPELSTILSLVCLSFEASSSCAVEGYRQIFKSMNPAVRAMFGEVEALLGCSSPPPVRRKPRDLLVL